MELSSRAKAISPSLTLEITARAKKMKSDGADVISFAAGEPDFDTPDYIAEGARRAIEKGMTKYTPVSGMLSLRAAICDKLKKDNGLSYSPENIVVSNGAKQSLFNAFAALLDDGDAAIVPSPYWLSYPEMIKLAGGVPVFVRTKPQNGFKITAAELEAAITDRTKVFLINSPNNPTGAVYDKNELFSLADVCVKHGLFVISDEIYEKLVYGCEHTSIAAYSDLIGSRTVVVNGMSKAYAMTGWRVGYAAADVALAKAMSNIQSHTTSNANSIAQYASAVALSDARGEEFLKRMVSEFAERRETMTAKLRKAGLDIIEPRGAFYVMASVKPFLGKICEKKRIGSAMDLALALLDNALVATVPCEGFGAPDYIRLSYAASNADIERGTDRIAHFLSSLSDK